MNLGEVLKAARTSSGISIDDLASITSIRAGLLGEMESNNFSHCGGDIYARGHLRNIAPKLGLDANQLVDLYNQEHSVESRSINEMLAENSVTRVPHEKKNLSWKVPAAFSIAILLILGVAQIVYSNINSSTQPRRLLLSLHRRQQPNLPNQPHQHRHQNFQLRGESHFQLQQLVEIR